MLLHLKPLLLLLRLLGQQLVLVPVLLLRRLSGLGS